MARLLRRGKVKKAPVEGGAPEIIANGSAGRGGSCGAHGDIIFTPAQAIRLRSPTATHIMCA